MTRFLFILLLWSKSPGAPKHALELRASVERQTYCLVDQKTASIQISFALTLTNTGSRPVSIYDPPGIGVLSAASLAQLKKTTFAYTGPDWIKTEKNEKTSEESDSVMQLSPGQTFKTKAEIPVLISRINRDRSQYSLVRGLNFVQVEVDSFADVSKLNQGEFERTLSQPLRLETSIPENTKACEGWPPRSSTNY
jgi:hypothetical protein